ncbi:uncharacterized protein PAE49_004212 [Odontesthes bonariensis]
MAVLRKTAEICRDIAASEGRNFSLNNSIALMQRFNAKVDFDFQQSEEHHFYSETFLKGREVITAVLEYLSFPIQSVGRGIYQADFTGIPGGVFVLRLKGEESSSTPNTFQRQSTLKITTSTIFITAKSSATSIEADSSVSVPFTVAITTNGVVNDAAAGTFTVRANNDRGYASTSPNTVTFEGGSGGTDNGTVTLTVPANAASGTDVTLTIEAQDAAATDINYTVLRFSVIERVTDIASPVCQEVSISPICPSSSSLCASSQWEFIANFIDGISGTGIESISISQGNSSLNEIKMVGAGGESITRVT